MYLSFSQFRAARLGGGSPSDPVEQLRRAAAGEIRWVGRPELVAAASGTHATREAAEDYARREGRIILTPEGDIYEIAAEPPSGADLRAAEYDRQYAEARRWTPAP